MTTLFLSKANKVVAESKESGPSAESGSTVKEKQGEQREGKYAARTQIGYEKDGSPQYRYFKTMEEYKTYLDNKGRSAKKDKKDPKASDKGKGDLEDKVKKEQAESKDKSGNLKSQEKKNLFVKKSLTLRLYVR